MKSGDQVSRYTVLGKLAKGGMAEVWLARQRGPAGFNKTLVLKTVASPMNEDPNFVTMFLEEARLAALLNHPNVVQIFDLDEWNGQHFIAMEYLDGRNLGHVQKALRERQIQIDVATAVRIIAEACAGMEYAHTLTDPSGAPLNIIHRDVTPENMFMTYQGQVKLLDFGIAKAAASSNLTQPGTVRGKLAFLAPEQVMAQKLDKRVDLWALGVNLYVLLTGTFPFGGGNDLEFMRSILEKEPVPPSVLRPDIPESLDAILMRALQKEPARRVSTAGELRAMLEGFLQPLPAVGGYHLAQLMENLFPAQVDAARLKLRALLEADAVATSSPRLAPVTQPSVPAQPDLPATRPLPTPTGPRSLEAPGVPDQTIPNSPRPDIGEATMPAVEVAKELPAGELALAMDVEMGELNTSQFQAMIDHSVPAASVTTATSSMPPPDASTGENAFGNPATVPGGPPEMMRALAQEVISGAAPLGTRPPGDLADEVTHIVRERPGGDAADGLDINLMAVQEPTTQPSSPSAIAAANGQPPPMELPADALMPVPVTAEGTAPAPAPAGVSRVKIIAGAVAAAAIGILALVLIPGKPAVKDPVPPVAITTPVPDKPPPDKPTKTRPPPDKPTPDKPAPDKPAPDKPAPDKPAPDKPAPDKPAPDKPAPDKPAPDKPAPDKPVAEDPPPKPDPAPDPDPEPTTKSPGNRRPPKQPPKPGTLNLNSSLKAEAFVDGHKVGKTPLNMGRVSAGEHRVRLVADNGAVMELTVNVPAGGTVDKKVEWKLGQLMVRAVPWATVKVDGRQYGTTPLPPIKLTAGSHEVVLENKQVKARRNFKVNIKEGGTEELKVKMEE